MTDMSKLEKKLLKEVKKRNITFSEVNAIIDRIKNPELKVKTVQHYWGGKHIKIGLGSDAHIGSIYKNQSTLDDIFKRFKKEGVEAVYLAGDMTEGYNMRPGHSYICNLHGADAQIKGTIDDIPDINKPIYFITGDHDYSHFKRQGIDVGKHISDGRKDLHYLGMFEADVDLGKHTKMKLKHPAGGSSLAYSHQLQRIVDRMDDKPEILALGHYHKLLYVNYHKVHGFLAGTVQNQTEWMNNKNIEAMKGAWILDVYMKRNGAVDRLDMKLLSYN